MKTIQENLRRILSIFPNAKGFGFAVVETTKGLIDWGAKRVHPPKNEACLTKVSKLVEEYNPDTVVLPNENDPRRCQRIRTLISEIAEAPKKRGIEVVMVTHKQVQDHFARYDVAKSTRSRSI